MEVPAAEARAAGKLEEEEAMKRAIAVVDDAERDEEEEAMKRAMAVAEEVDKAEAEQQMQQALEVVQEVEEAEQEEEMKGAAAVAAEIEKAEKEAGMREAEALVRGIEEEEEMGVYHRHHHRWLKGFIPVSGFSLWMKLIDYYWRKKGDKTGRTKVERNLRDVRVVIDTRNQPL